MHNLLENGYTPKMRPSGHDISGNFATDNGGAIPPNLLAIPNTESNGPYQQYCKEHGIRPHPARFPTELPEYFVRFLTDKGDLVVDPFAGSCVTGEVAERLGRRWVCVDLEEEYLEGALGRFGPDATGPRKVAEAYTVARPGSLWKANTGGKLRADGGRSRGR